MAVPGAPMKSSSVKSQGLRVAVIGAGVIGLSAALEMRARGADVVVYDAGVELGAGATIRSAGMLGAAFEWAVEEDQRALAALARHAGMIWPDFAARVERLSGGGLEYSAEGALVVARTAAEVEWAEGIAAACQARGLPVKRLSAVEMKRLEPALADGLQGGMLLPEDRQVDASLALQRLAAALSRQGVGIRLGRKIDRIVGGAMFQTPDGDKFNRIVLATGAGALPEFVGPRGASLPHGLAASVPVKGQMLALAPAMGGPRHVIHTRDVYIAPKARWTLVGATSERGRQDLEIDRKAIEDLRRRGAMVAPVLGTATEFTAWAGVRPGTPDDAPMIGQTAIPGVFAALGHFRNGVLFAPATAELVAEQAIDGKVSPLAAAFDPLRFDKNGD